MVKALLFLAAWFPTAAVAVCWKVAQMKPGGGMLQGVGAGLLVLGTGIFVTGLLFFSSCLFSSALYLEVHLLCIWLLFGALFLGTGLLIYMGRFSLTALLCLVFIIALLGSLPILSWH